MEGKSSDWLRGRAALPYAAVVLPRVVIKTFLLNTSGWAREKFTPRC